MVKLPALIRTWALLNFCVCATSSQALRKIHSGGGLSDRRSSKGSLEREPASLLQLSFGLSSVAEAQVEMASMQDQMSSSSSSTSSAVRETAVDSLSTAESPRYGVTSDDSGAPVHGSMLPLFKWNALDATSQNYSSRNGGLVFVSGFVIGAVVCGLLPILGYALARALCKRIERGVAASDRMSFGVDIDIGKLSVNLYEGYIVVHGLTVFNPPGYSAEYLLKAETVNVDIRMATLVCSCFRTVQVEKVVFSGVDVLYDKSWSSSNINDVIISTTGGGSTAAKLEQIPDDGVKCTMRKVFFEDVVVRQPMVGKANLALAAADLDVQDFSAEIGESCLYVAAFAVLRRVLKTASSHLEQHAAVAGVIGKQ